MKKIFIIGISLLLIGSIIGGNFHNKIFGSQLNDDQVIFIKSTDTIDDILLTLSSYCKDYEDIKWVAQLKRYKYPKAGKYVLKRGWNANHIINTLRSGNQTPVKVTFNNQNYVEDLAGRLSYQIEADSLMVLNALTDPEFLASKKLTTQQAIGLYLPYTYECYWTISPTQLRNKLVNAHHRFWNANNRLNQAKKIGLTTMEVTVLASIVHKESYLKVERPKIAGVYLNRLKRGIPLQADPTIIYVIKELKGHDTVIKRVLTKDTHIHSDFNTYEHPGLPPAPIAMPDIDAIEAVLNAEQHNYLYFCSNPKKMGTHLFARTLSQHNKNAKIYHNWLNKQQLYR